MQIYSRKHFVMGLVWLGVAALRIWVRQGRPVGDILPGVIIPVALAVGAFADAFKKQDDPQQQAEKIAQAGRKLYGCWWLVVQNAGYVVIIAALVSMLIVPNGAGIALFAVLAGFGWSGVVESRIKEEAEKL